jgi:uncharacterized protein YqfA (UPF0365 family)
LNVDVLLLILRVITGVALLAFLGAVFMVLWRDYRAAVVAAAVTQRQRGRLVVVQPERAVANESDSQTADLTGAVDALEGAELAGTSFPLLPLTSLGRGPMNTVVLTATAATVRG